MSSSQVVILYDSLITVWNVPMVTFFNVVGGLCLGAALLQFIAMWLYTPKANRSTARI
jgi:hypothetical protein